MSLLIRYLLLAALALPCVAIQAVAQDLPPVRVQNGISYVTGGIGADESDALRAQAHRYSLRILFAAREGNYLSDVDVTISTRGGERMLNVHTEGPFLYVNLPPGAYRVDAHAGSGSETRPVTIVPHRGRDLLIRLDAPTSLFVPPRCPGCKRIPAPPAT